MLLCWGENETLRAWTVNHDGEIAFKAHGREVASQGAPGLGGMPGGMLTLSADHSKPNTGLVWTTTPEHGDGNRGVVDGIMRVYDATDFATDANDGDPVIKLLWDTKQLPVSFKYDKFCPPVVANGKVYVTTYDGRVDVYGP